jgi:hypothetical protein
MIHLSGHIQSRWSPWVRWVTFVYILEFANAFEPVVTVFYSYFALLEIVITGFSVEVFLPGSASKGSLWKKITDE